MDGYGRIADLKVIVFPSKPVLCIEKSRIVEIRGQEWIGYFAIMLPTEMFYLCVNVSFILLIVFHCDNSFLRGLIYFVN